MVNKPIIPWWEPQTGLYELKYLRKVIRSNFPNEGNFTYLFEEKIAGLVGSKYCVSVTSGTIALFLALKGLGVDKGDEVIVPDLCFIAAANAVDLCGARPVFVDIDPKNLMLNPNLFEKAITKKTKAVIPVHVSGRSADIESILKIAKRRHVFVVEDACEALMSKHKGKYLGTFGDAGCFSFSPAKTITTGQGGAIVTDNHKLYLILKQLKDQGRSERGTGGDDIHHTVGYNFKFTNLQAAFGLGQLAYLKKRIARLRRNHLLYLENLKAVKEIKIFKADIKNGEVPLWTDAVCQNRDGLDRYLRQNGIDCRRFWFPLHTQAPYQQSGQKFKESVRLSPKVIWLPSAFTLRDADIYTVCNYIKKFYGK